MFNSGNRKATEAQCGTSALAGDTVEVWVNLWGD